MKMQAHELRRDMKEALDRVARVGERIIITRNGSPIAQLVPYDDQAPAGAPTGAELIDRFRRSVPLARVSDKELAAMRDRSRERRRD